MLVQLIRIYEDTSPDTLLYMGDDFNMKFVELQNEAETHKKLVNELEITCHFAKKLLDLNAEVSFIGGAEFVSTQASERVFSIEKYVEKLIADIRLKEIDLTKAKTKHIEKVKKSSAPAEETCDTNSTGESVISFNENEQDSNFEIMNSRED